MISAKLKWIKELPKKELNKFEDRTIYNCAVYTREFTKSSNAFPYLSGKLMQNEVAMPIQELGNKTYGLGAGVDYAVYVWEKNKAVWTSPATKPKWYYTVFQNNSASIVHQAVQSALKEI